MRKPIKMKKGNNSPMGGVLERNGEEKRKEEVTATNEKKENLGKVRDLRGRRRQEKLRARERAKVL